MRPSRLIYKLFLPILLLACSNDAGNRNPNLQELGFRFEMNLNLPLYSPLTSTGNPVYVGNTGAGIRGFFVMNTGFDQMRAFEASCPNHPPNGCSTMEIDGQNAVCSCEGYSYSLFTGQLLDPPGDGARYYNMLEYRATRSGDVVTVSN